MGLLEKMAKERKMCYIIADDEILYEYSAIILDKTVVICDVTMKCVEIPKLLLNHFLRQLFKGYKHIRLSCS